MSNVYIRVGPKRWVYEHPEKAWRRAARCYRKAKLRSVAARRAKAEAGLMLLAIKAGLCNDPAYSRSRHSPLEGWSQMVAARGMHRQTAARMIEEAVRNADQAVMLGGKVIGRPLCEPSQIAPLCRAVWPESFSGVTARFDRERESWLAKLSQEHAERLRGERAGGLQASPTRGAEDFADLPLFFERAQSRLAAGELGADEAAKVREAFELIRRVGMGGKEKRVGADADVARTA